MMRVSEVDTDDPAWTMRRAGLDSDQPDDLWRWAMHEAERLRYIEGADIPILDDTVPADRETLTMLLASLRDELHRLWAEHHP